MDVAAVSDNNEESNSHNNFPAEYMGWKLSKTVGGGALGPQTTAVIAERAEARISALAASPDAALGMIRDMIDKRVRREGSV